MKDWIGQVWCKMMHREAMWPIHGKYVCPRCLREYPVAWNDARPVGSRAQQASQPPEMAPRVALGTVHAVDSCQSPILR